MKFATYQGMTTFISRFGLQLKAKQEKLFENEDWNNPECRDELIKKVEAFLENNIK